MKIKNHIVIILLIVGLCGCIEKNHEIEILNHEMNFGHGLYGEGVYVSGTAKNNANYKQTVTIKGKLYDENNKYLGSNDWFYSKKVSDYPIPSGYSWEFKMVFFGDFVTDAKTVEFVISTS